MINALYVNGNKSVLPGVKETGINLDHVQNGMIAISAVQSGDFDAVIVEDCPSACAVSNILTGIAIMGTKLKDVQKLHLKPYKNLYICLDRDATTKAYDMAKDLRSSGFDNIICSG